MLLRAARPVHAVLRLPSPVGPCVQCTCRAMIEARFQRTPTKPDGRGIPLTLKGTFQTGSFSPWMPDSSGVIARRKACVVPALWIKVPDAPPPHFSLPEVPRGEAHCALCSDAPLEALGGQPSRLAELPRRCAAAATPLSGTPRAARLAPVGR